ncbi:hypothetical protein LPN04_29530 [Rugamonas sp. A1-17]|nr:hypothetical protein [Rugamonas sp. A1-17]
MNNCVHILTDAFALASAALDNGSIEPPRDAVASNPLFNLWVIEGNGVRTLVRENVSAQLSNALVSSANYGAKVQGLARSYEAVQVESINSGRKPAN